MSYHARPGVTRCALAAFSRALLTRFRSFPPQLARCTLPDGRRGWSAPSAFTVGGGGGGLEFGGAVAHYILILNSEDAVRHFEGHGLNMSVTLQAALGPHQAGRSVEGGVRIALPLSAAAAAAREAAGPPSPGDGDGSLSDAQGGGSSASLASLDKAASSPPARVTATYVYGQSAGFFLGAGLQGGVVSPRTWENSAYYGVPDARAEDILSGRVGLSVEQQRPEVAALHAVLAKAQDAHAEWGVPPDGELSDDFLSDAPDGAEALDDDDAADAAGDDGGAPPGDAGKPPRGRSGRPVRAPVTPGEDAEKGEFELFVPGRVW